MKSLIARRTTATQGGPATLTPQRLDLALVGPGQPVTPGLYVIDAIEHGADGSPSAYILRDPSAPAAINVIGQGPYRFPPHSIIAVFRNILNPQE